MDRKAHGTLENCRLNRPGEKPQEYLGTRARSVGTYTAYYCDRVSTSCGWAPPGDPAEPFLFSFIARPAIKEYLRETFADIERNRMKRVYREYRKIKDVGEKSNPGWGGETDTSLKLLYGTHSWSCSFAGSVKFMK